MIIITSESLFPNNQWIVFQIKNAFFSKKNLPVMTWFVWDVISYRTPEGQYQQFSWPSVIWPEGSSPAYSSWSCLFKRPTSKFDQNPWSSTIVWCQPFNGFRFNKPMLVLVVISSWIHWSVFVLKPLIVEN